MRTKKIDNITNIWEALSGNSNEGALMLAPNGEIRDFNKRFAEILNLPTKALYGKTIWEITPEKWHSIDRIIFNKLATRKERSRTYRKEYISGDGTTVRVEVFALSVFTEEKCDAIWCFVRLIDGISTRAKCDIHERKNCLYEITDMALTTNKTEQQILESIVELLPSGFHFPEKICIKISYKFKVFKSDNYRRTRWFQRSDIVQSGRRIGEIEIGYIDDDEDTQANPFEFGDIAFTASLAEKISKIGELKSLQEEAAHTAENERRRSEEFRKTNEELKRIQKSMLNLMEDLRCEIDERNAAKVKLDAVNNELKVKNKELEQIIYVASHDMRTPLVTIAGFSNELILAIDSIIEIIQSANCNLGDESKRLKEIVEEDIPSSVKFMTSGINRIQLMLDGLLMYSRTGREEMHFEKVDIGRIVENVLESVMFGIEDLGIEVKVGKLPPCKADKIKIMQVFSNLIENAMKFQKHGCKGRIEISGKKKGMRVVYCVRDNGIGIPKNKIEDIFLLFYKVDSSTNIGEGLGLAVVKKLVEKNEGRVWVESELGEGCAFYIELPAK